MGDRRLRLSGAFLGLLGLILSFVSLPASAHTVNDPAANNVYNGTWPPNSSTVWNQPATNPPIGSSCGIDVGILIDRSGSIADAGQQTNMRNSAKAIVTSLAGTPSRVGVWSFGNDSSATGTADYPAQQLTSVGGVNGPAGVTSLSATIDSIPIVSGVATNWEAGFNSVHVSSVAHTAPKLLFVLTDGKPTVHIDDSATGGTTNNDDVDGGIRTANLVKGDGTRVFGVGIGAGIDASTLGLVANPVAYNGSNFTTAGYTLTSFSELESTLRTLVTELCGGSVTVEKLADNGSGTFQPASGWDFTLDPTNAQIPNQTKSTDANGQANFKIDSFASEQVTLTENLAAKPGYQLLADQLSCTNSNGPNPTLTPVLNGVQFNLGPTDIVSCTFKNKKQFVDLGIAKSDGGVSTVPGGNVTYTLTYGNKGNAPAPNTVITETVPANTTVDLGVGPADGKNDGWLCNGANSGVWPAGTTCTRAVGTVAAGASGLTVPFTVTVVNPAPFGLSLITNTATIGYDGSVGPDTNPADNTATDTTPVSVNPGLTITKKVVAAGQPCSGAVDSLTIVAGQSVTYCYVVTNPGNGPTVNVKVRDDNATPGNPADDFDVVLTGLTDQDGDGQPDDLAAGATATGQSANKVFNSGGTYTNTATATGGGKTVTDTATVTVTQPSLNIVKTAVKTGDACPGTDGATLTVVTGQDVTYCYVVTNPGNAPLLNVAVRDDNGTPGNPADDFDVTLTGLSELGGGQGKDLAAGGTATGTSSPKSFDAVGTVTNIATATGKSASGATFSKTDDATVTVTQPAVNLVKTVVKTGQACPGIDGVPLTVVAGQSVTYCYVVTNPGNAPLLNVKVRDDNGTPANPADDFDVTLTGLSELGGGQGKDLAAGATATGTSAPKVIDGTGSVTNIATAGGVSASQRSTVDRRRRRDHPSPG
ncbi:MAG: VWA domain-containing protein [Acidimicrobiales bacterium]